MESTMALIIQLVSGALGGTLAGGLLKKLSLGTALNSILGIIGGGLGGQWLKALGFGVVGGPGMDSGSIIANILGGGVGGGVRLAIVGAVKKAVAKKLPFLFSGLPPGRGLLSLRPIGEVGPGAAGS